MCLVSLVYSVCHRRVGRPAEPLGEAHRRPSPLNWVSQWLTRGAEESRQEVLLSTSARRDGDRRQQGTAVEPLGGAQSGPVHCARLGDGLGLCATPSGFAEPSPTRGSRLLLTT